jgi:hypothetical protein
VSDSTTIKVRKSTRDAVRQLADADGVSLDSEIQRLARRERQRRIADALAEPLTEEQQDWVVRSSATVGRLAGG